MKQLCSLFIFISINACAQKLSPEHLNATDEIYIIPQPVSINKNSGEFIISKNTVIVANDETDRKTAALLNEYLQTFYGLKLDIDRKEGRDYIRLSTRNFIQAPEKDAYQLQVNQDGVNIEGDTHAGTFYGMQSLIQLLPVHNNKNNKNLTIGVPLVSINDSPRFKYRGMHLDVARHFFPVSFVKKYIDYLAQHKINYFHWHLTDDQGWRIEIKKYPALVDVASCRNGTIVGRYPGTKNDNEKYCGYYTQDEVKDIVQYAADRHITVVPEIEMPGHASAAIAAYPWLSCFPEKETNIPSHPSEESKKLKGKKVQETWGVFEDIFCAGKESTFIFLENVLEEVLSLFPSQYIHVGGDEAPKSHWKKCSACQARIKNEGLKDEHQLQSYFIQRMEKFLNNKGRILIGWDEILEGGLAPNAVVMSWRGESGGIAAAKENHYVIMTPQKPVYFDHAQTRTEDSVVIGGFNPLEAVYQYEPIPAELTGDQGKYVLGAQANVWTEYIKYPSRVEYTIFPRMSALSEVLWTDENKKNWNQFEKKLQTQFKRYDQWGANYSKAYYDVKLSFLPTPNNQGVTLKMKPRDNAGVLQYKINNGGAVKYTTPVLLNKSGDILVSYYRNDNLINSIPFTFSYNIATGKKITIKKAPTQQYPGQGGAFGLVNGIWSKKGLSHPDWLGWIGDDIEATIDLGKQEKISSVKMHTLNQNGSWIYLPSYIEVFTSTDGKVFKSQGRSNDFVKDTLTMGFMNVNFNPVTTRFVKLIAKNYGLIPEGQPGAGNKAWIFADEIQIF
jgi:hexosaminidase